LILGPLETQVMQVLWMCGECSVREVIPRMSYPAMMNNHGPAGEGIASFCGGEKIDGTSQAENKKDGDSVTTEILAFAPHGPVSRCGCADCMRKAEKFLDL